jgi:hypothetical protein
MDVLRAVRDQPNPLHSMQVYNIVNLIVYLQEQPAVGKSDILAIEWGFLPLLDRHHGGYPKHLEQELATNSEFFCEVIRIVFRSKNGDAQKVEIDENQKFIIKNAFRLLNDWRTPPGTQANGLFNGEALDGWVEGVKRNASQSGHLEIALTRMGHALRYTPADPDGLWIDSSVAAILDASDARDARDGFISELFNSRGVHNFSAGEEERQLAAKYRSQASDVDSRGFHRLASSLRALADSYDRDAERQAAVDLYDD